MKKILIIVLIIVVIAVIIALLMPMRFGNIDDSIPGGVIEGRVAGLKLHVKSKCFSSAADGQTTVKEYDVTLTPIERINLTVALLNPMFDASALDSYTYAPDEIIADKKDHEEYWQELYADCDLNKDGIVTRREFADWLVLCGTPWGMIRECFM